MSDDSGMPAARGHAAADRLLFRTARAGGPWTCAVAAAALVLAVAELALPAVLGQAVDEILTDGGPGSWLIWCAALIAALVAADALDDVATGAVVARSTAWLRRTVFEHALDVGPRGSAGLPVGELTTRLVGNAAEAGRVAPDVVRAVATLVPSVGGVVALAIIDPWLCVTFVAGLPILLLAVRAFARDATTQAAGYLRDQGEIAGRLVDATAGARTIAAAGTVDREVGRVLEPLPALRRHGEGMWRAQMRISAQDALILSMLEVAVLAVAGVQLAHGRLTPGELLAAGQYVFLAGSLGAAVNAVTRLTRSRAAAARLVDVLEQPTVAYGRSALRPGGGRLELRGVTVRRDGDAVLDRLSLVVPAGALVAVVGRSGAGKSLLAALAGRLADPDEGEVLLDGTPLRELRRSELRAAVAYGFERPNLVGSTVRDAIALGAEPVADDRVLAAAMSARAHDFIRGLPLGYRTPLRRAPLSGGEAQRLGLARAFVRAGRVIVLDDVAASLDTVTELQISGVLTAELSDRTRIVVAHRASTAARADVVVWLDGGRVRALAPHDELWCDPGYRALFEPVPVAGTNGAGR